jgi:hypothetical protein
MNAVMNTAAGRLIRAELKLMTRDPLVLTFVFAFPIVTMLIIGGAFGTKPNPGFDNTNPSHWYVASYLTVVIAAVGWSCCRCTWRHTGSAGCCAGSRPLASRAGRSPSRSSWSA